MINNSISDLKQTTYFIIAGEESADNHGATLMNAIYLKNPNVKFYGIGGMKMIESELKSIENIEKMAVMGFVEVIRHLVFFYNLTKKILVEIDVCKPRQIILIDYPGFNLRLAKKIKEQLEVMNNVSIEELIKAEPILDIQLVVGIQDLVIIFP